MISLNKFLPNATVIGSVAFMLWQGIGTTAGIYHFNHLSELASENQIKTTDLNGKFENMLSDSKYSEFLQDPYLSSPEFVSQRDKYDRGNEAHIAAIKDYLSQAKKGITETYPLTSFAFENAEESLKNQININMETVNKWKLAKSAENSCNPRYPTDDPAAVELGQKYFCK
jgi:hypothetical protein